MAGSLSRRHVVPLVCGLVLLLAASGAAAGGKAAREAARHTLTQEVTALEHELSAATELRLFCQRDLEVLERRFERSRPAWTAAGEKEVELEVALAEVRSLRSEVDAELAGCRETALRQVQKAVAALTQARDTARQWVAAERGAAAAAPSAVLLETDDLLAAALPTMLEQGRFRAAIDAAQRATRELETSLTGSSCEDQMGLAEHRLALGSPAAVELLCELAKRRCLTPGWPQAALARLDELAAAVRAGTGGALTAEAGRAPLTVVAAAEVAAGLAACMPDRFADVVALVRPEVADAALAETGREQAVEQILPSDREGKADVPESAPEEPASYLALDVWQSAWGDFSELASLGEYLQRNHIREVNLNPGIAMKPGLEKDGLVTVRPLVEQLREAGVTTTRYLYAELGYDIGAYARFLGRHPELGMTTIIDDSEFTDPHRGRFEANQAAVKEVGLSYAAFVTVEEEGNSGVSDATRKWAIRNLDEVIFMSYLSCTLDGQKEVLEPLLSYADSFDRRGTVRVALLLGGKKMGRELSCEQELGATAFQGFLRELHGWARQHPSYGGVVLETSQRLPSYDVAPRPLP